MVGGEGPPGLVTLKVSVRQLVISATEIRGAGAVVAIGMLFTMPELGSRLATEVLTVLGPLMVKVSKSKRICGKKIICVFCAHCWIQMTYLADVVSSLAY